MRTIPNVHKGFRSFSVVLWGRSESTGGAGGLRTPDRLTPMSDFESGAFNRALAPLRIVSHSLQMAYGTASLPLFISELPVSGLVSLYFPECTRRSTADAWFS